MSIVETYKSEMILFYYDEDPLRGQSLQDHFQSRGYQFQYYSSRGLLTEALQLQPPHIFLLHYQPLSMRFQELIKTTQDVSDEVEIIALHGHEFWPGVQKLIDKQMIFDAWPWPVDHRALQVRIDRALEKTLYRYLAEQRSPVTERICTRLDELTAREKTDVATTKSPEASFDIFSSGVSSEADAATYVLNHLKESQTEADFVYMKTYPARDQLLIYKTSFADSAYFRGQHFPFSLESYNRQPEAELDKLKTQLKEILRCGDFHLQEVEHGDHTFGFVMAINGPQSEFLSRCCRQLALFLRHSQLESSQRRPDWDANLELEIPSQQFPLVLSREISRARRLKSPVSLVTTKIEFVYNQEHQTRHIFDLIKESLRAYDLICRLEPDSFALILPHCGYQDAAIKAENLRREIVARGLQTQSPPLRLCFGVSEFPRLSQDSDALLEDAKKACAQVYASGKNKVCLYQAPGDFSAEFEPGEIASRAAELSLG